MQRKLSFEIEGEGVLENPTFPAIEAGLTRINPSGPSFFILSDDTGAYVQTAGAKARVTVEFRERDGAGFRHFVLGRASDDTTEFSIKYSGGAIRLRKNEILSLRDAGEVFRRFFESGSISERFSKRETTDMFK